MALVYSVFEDHAVVNRYLPDNGVNIVHIPEKTEGVPVTEIGPGAFSNSKELKTVVIPINIVRIDREAFSGCKNLTCVGVAASDKHSVFPSVLKYIGERAFYGTGLKELSVPSSEIILERECFRDSGLISAFFTGTDITLCDGVFMNAQLEIVAMPNAEIERLGDNCFASCSTLLTIRAKGINGVGKDCLRECTELTEFSAKRPLDYVGDGAFYNCRKLKLRGHFRTMRDLISAWGVRYIVNETARRKFENAFWKPQEYDKRSFDINIAVNRIVDKICNTKATTESNLLLLRVIGSEYYDMSDGWEYSDRFLIYKKDDVGQQFRDIWDWNITDDLCELYVQPPARLLGDLTVEEVCRCLCYENRPKPQVVDWNNLDVLLNADLGGDAALYHSSTVTDFISCLIDHELGATPADYTDIPTAELGKYFVDGKFSAEERLHALIWDILYNRLAIYKELKQANRQLHSEE